MQSSRSNKLLTTKTARIGAMVTLLCFVFLQKVNGEEQKDSVVAQYKSEVAQVLDSLHKYAAIADGKSYFDLFTENARYIGTDAAETWTLDEFKKFAMPYFSKGTGWLYVPTSREITLSTDQEHAWFVELLDNKKYGVSRGTGVLVRTDKGWRITQYHLTFPVPNELAEPITRKIKALKNQ